MKRGEGEEIERRQRRNRGREACGGGNTGGSSSRVHDASCLAASEKPANDKY